ncbi:Asp-tRNA(Asn)/Glu-tRNA(Gln) amidotransferase subunit GatC [Latilactobacillus curvatus]|uniref:Aspartyl/glutamyl-tRNA(Asn/Gln) amidotransferase subunit C n=1 Tax=Latilactobacillus curvatus TaxID=28038 RepID=A0A385ACH2_LATCU|nr:Asp-tRNA(Asn)/Glu-tRNA(Gln) amidotransferase subunit GatC [Latilactobacillus curvatus]AXN35313.1 Asp-tRNA(Asn)/Glu-tRNA(Gln) amidotransferase subunit GatC [Latilactobacillus curvatus]AZP96922.1 Asp-tRNA(Asn)/Glu-tRNA(Gln) amidotransferase subunit GatC [Latilactobacillus curvatus]MCM6844241.1 Asp-tRNA(Asn)/Glu-tRNA(Gln) amidotransferase subunit GatC [Latilactobacillus curvatus]MCM6860872.1 Asp-tRNA(Asn)/Glu-tRNA(Gln) amidotransferase subunit GatC [Latilactobacillus curvatus]MCM6868170.1 Asp-
MINKTQVQHVAELSKLAFSDAELEQFTEQLADIMKMTDELNKVDTTGVPVTTHVNNLQNIVREDVAQAGTDREILMKNAPDSADGLLKVPAIMDKEED